MAVDMFIKIGDIKGESTASGKQDWIEVESWSWGQTQLKHAGGGGGGAGKVAVQDISITKYIDKSSPDLMLHCATGNHIPQAVLTCRKAGATGEVSEFIKITLSDILVSSFAPGGSGGEDRLTESVSLNFAKIEIHYTFQDPRGGTQEFRAGWDRRARTSF